MNKSKMLIFAYNNDWRVCISKTNQIVVILISKIFTPSDHYYKQKLTF